MSIKFAKRAASEIMGRGGSAIRIKPSALSDAAKAITKDDVRKLISDKNIYAIPEKHNVSMNSKVLRKKRDEGRRRGPGRRKGTFKARAGRRWEKKVRSQRMLLRSLKQMKKIDNKTFGKFYGLVKGNAFPDKASLLLHLGEKTGVKLSAEELAKIDEQARARYK